MNTDPIADMLTRIRNANMVSLTEVDMPSSKLKVELAKLLKSEGYVEDYAVVEKEGSAFKTLKITLKYDEKSKPVISNLKRVSRPGLRNYCKAKNIPQVLGGMGIAIISTSKGLLTDRKARKENVGGEILCYVW
ncbi:TPA: 30S ribosomal protein S8 [Candidatus Avigastranaerophilus faecigallinarum]|nr:30S ribosomal protein S8 [Candidatus Avigastranaerophilus faecigallinarum]